MEREVEVTLVVAGQRDEQGGEYSLQALQEAAKGDSRLFMSGHSLRMKLEVEIDEVPSEGSTLGVSIGIKGTS